MWWSRNKDKEQPSIPVQAVDVLAGTELAFVAYRLENGYLVRFSIGLGMQAKVFFCANEQEIAERVVAERAKKVVLGEQTGITKSGIFRVSNASVSTDVKVT